jgi:uroporphyrinogen-III decarboxylase
MTTAMRLGVPARVPAMCQLAIGHTLLQSGVHPLDFFLDSQAYADGLLAMRERYRFDGVLLHKPGREPAFRDLVARVDRDGAVPTLHLTDGAAIECPRDDDPIYRDYGQLRRPEVVEMDPEQPFAWAPPSYVAWCRHKGTALYLREDEIPPYWYDAIDRVRAAAGAHYHVHGEVRSPLDHLMALLGLENALLALLTEPDHCHALLATLTRMSAVWAVAQLHRGCDAIKLSSPYAGAGFLSRAMYQEWVLPGERQVAEAVRAAGGLIYTHTCGAIGDRLDLIAASGVHGIETLDPPPLGTVDLVTAKRQLRDKLFIKGNIDPVGVMRLPPEQARPLIRQTLAIGRQGGQYILSTACSVPPRAPAATVALLAELVRE